MARSCQRSSYFCFAVPLLVALAACGKGPPGQTAATQTTHGQKFVSSNILRADYAGTAACNGCHGEIHARWLESPMHRMTRDARTADIVAPFNAASFEFKSDVAKMSSHAGARFIEVQSALEGNRIFRVTKVIGGRVREDFAGVPVAERTPEAPALGEEQILPVSYLIFSGEWRYKGYSVMVKERPALADGLVWRRTCIFCHNTAPHLSTILDEMHGSGAPGFQGSASVELPNERRFRYRITDSEALAVALAAEHRALGEAQRRATDDVQGLLAGAMDVTNDAFGEEHLIEIGIGCEACHNGAREHAKNPAFLPSFGLRSEFLEVQSPTSEALTRAQDINRTCAKCHTVLFSRYPYTWEGGGRSNNPGGSNINSGEGRDFMLGGCTTQLSCAACHDVHAPDSRALLAKFETSEGNAVCAKCHAAQSGRLLSAHTHHAPDSTGSVCVNCHMPKKNMGLAYQLTRYHRIGSPTDADRVERDRPIECALCHADKSVDQLVKTLERFWGKRYDRNALYALYGRDLRINVVSATLMAGRPHEKAVAAELAATLRSERALPLLIAELNNPYPLVRFYMKNAIERIVGEKLPLDMHAPGEQISRSAEHWLESLKQRPASATSARK